MARFGYGYSTQITDALDEILIGINEGLSQAFEMTCDDLQEKINDEWNSWINDVYSYDPEKYERTYELVQECPIKFTKFVPNAVSGSVEATFDFIDGHITTINNPQHHAMEQSNDGMYGIVNLLNVTGAFHDLDSFVEIVIDIINNNWDKIYREKCRELGLSL